MRSANSILSIVIVTVIVLAVNPVWAHFGMIIPSYSMVMQKDNRNVDLVLSFSHPFEGQWNGTGKARSFRSFYKWKKDKPINNTKRDKSFKAYFMENYL